MGSVTNTNRRTTYGSAGKLTLTDITFSSSYAAGGDTYTNAQFGFNVIDAIIDQGAAVASSTTGYLAAPDLTNKKIRLLGGAASGVALAESGTAGQSSTVLRALIMGDNPYV
jgi:hypothetical protein